MLDPSYLENETFAFSFDRKCFTTHWLQSFLVVPKNKHTEHKMLMLMIDKLTGIEICCCSRTCGSTCAINGVVYRDAHSKLIGRRYLFTSVSAFVRLSVDSMDLIKYQNDSFIEINPWNYRCSLSSVLVRFINRLTPAAVVI